MTTPYALRLLAFMLPMLLLTIGCPTTVPADDDDDTTEEDWREDTDGDGIPDSVEGEGDPDGDGIPNSQDDDSDGDGIPDSVEAGDDDVNTPPADTDGDGAPDYLDQDSDGNGVPDSEEGYEDTDGDGIQDSADMDNDGDGILDEIEVGLDLDNPDDADGDGIPSYNDTDSDGDGILDEVEGGDDLDEDGLPNNMDTDSDGDGIGDADEVGDDPDNPLDTDGDGHPDYADADADNDGILDNDEGIYGTDVLDRDTDGDGFTDLAEVEWGSDPLDAGSVIEAFYVEIGAGEVTVDIPFTPEVIGADVLFLMDTTCSMDGVLNNMAGMFIDVVNTLTVPDIAYAVAEFDDYNYQQMGNASDLPFRLTQQITTDTALVQSALSSLFTRDGGDGPESDLEAIYQAATGMGYDMDCNGTLDSNADVPPFIADPADAFGGTVLGIYDGSIQDTGDLGGCGFRVGTVPVIVYATDAQIRDPDTGSPTPDACSNPAGSAAVTTAVVDGGIQLIGIGTTNGPISKMNDLAAATGSNADIDGDGIPEALVFQGAANQVATNVIDGITALSEGGEFDLELNVIDPYGFVVQIDPAVHPGVLVGTTITFELRLYSAVPTTGSDQVFILPMRVIGDGAATLAALDLVIVVQAS